MTGRLSGARHGGPQHPPVREGIEAFPVTVTGTVRKVEMRDLSVAEFCLGDVAATAPEG